MCLLLLMHRCVPEYPIVALANRDEDPARGGERPGPWEGGILAPRDPRSGGTWIGVNGHGVFSAVTNRHGPAPAGPQIQSRGTLPLEALKEKTAVLARQRAERIPTFVFAPFNWVYADARDAFVTEHGGPSDLTVHLRPGVHVLTNEHDLDFDRASDFLKSTGLSIKGRSLESILGDLQTIAGRHDPVFSEEHRVCKHEKSVSRTVSSSVIALHESNPALHRWFFHEGSPCRGRWQDVSDLFSKKSDPAP